MINALIQMNNDYLIRCCDVTFDKNVWNKFRSSKMERSVVISNDLVAGNRTHCIKCTLNKLLERTGTFQYTIYIYYANWWINHLEWLFAYLFLLTNVPTPYQSVIALIVKISSICTRWQAQGDGKEKLFRKFGFIFTVFLKCDQKKEREKNVPSQAYLYLANRP